MSKFKEHLFDLLLLPRPCIRSWSNVKSGQRLGHRGGSSTWHCQCQANPCPAGQKEEEETAWSQHLGVGRARIRRLLWPRGWTEKVQKSCATMGRKTCFATVSKFVSRREKMVPDFHWKHQKCIFIMLKRCAWFCATRPWAAVPRPCSLGIGASIRRPTQISIHLNYGATSVFNVFFPKKTIGGGWYLHSSGCYSTSIVLSGNYLDLHLNCPPPSHHYHAFPFIPNSFTQNQAKTVNTPTPVAIRDRNRFLDIFDIHIPHGVLVLPAVNLM